MHYIHTVRKFVSLGDQALVSGGNFLTIAACAHSLPLSEQGKFAYVFASYMALLLINVAGIFQGAAVRAPAQDHSYRISLARLQLLQAMLLSLIICTVWFVFGSVLSWEATAAEAGWLFSFLILQQLADFDRRSAYIFSGASRAFSSSAALYPLRIIGLLIIKPDTVTHVLMILSTSAIVPALFTIFSAGKSQNKCADTWIKEIRDHLHYSRIFIAGAPLGWLWAYIPVFLLGIMHGKEQAALLASIRGISNVANVLMEQIETKVVADWARVHHGSGSHTMNLAVSRLLKIGIIFWLLMGAIVVVFGREIVTLVLGNLYTPHWFLLVIGWGAYGVYFLARVLGVKHRTLGDNHVEFIGNICGVLAALLAGITLIYFYQATGAAWVYVIIAAVMLISQVLVMKNINLPTK